MWQTDPKWWIKNIREHQRGNQKMDAQGTGRRQTKDTRTSLYANNQITLIRCEPSFKQLEVKTVLAFFDSLFHYSTYYYHYIYRTWLYILVTRRVSHKKQELLTLQHEVTSVSWQVHVALYVLSHVLWCPLPFLHRNNIRFVFTSSCLKEGSHLINVIWLFAYSDVRVSLVCLLPNIYSQVR
jgi:hypothetical protein